MTYAPIFKVLTPFVDGSTNTYSGYVLKAYAAGSSANISMATSFSGKTTFTSVALNASGFPVVGGNVIIPHIAVDFKLALYPTQAAADADSGATWTIDNLPFGSLYQSVANHIKGEVIYIEDDVGAGATSFDIDANISATFESVGPTDSGATNIWTEMNEIPDGATFVILKLFNECDDSTGASILQSIFLRKGGSAALAGDQSLASIAVVTATGSTATKAHDVSSVKVPIDSNKIFDVYFISDGTTRDAKLYLVGFGV